MDDPNSTVQVHVQPHPFSVTGQLDDWMQGPPGSDAASALFLGRVRGETMDGQRLEALELSHYPGLCERLIDASARHLLQEHRARSALVLHRVGRLQPGELIVLVAVSADRRGAAQRCCGALLEVLKHEAPFWKREWCAGRGTWLTANTPL